MKIPKYISPSALARFEANEEEYYLGYCAQEKPPKIPQTQPMSIGSAFDAYVKAHISKELFGGIREGFAFEEMFEKQVEAEHRDWARVNGKWAFDCYILSGALADLMLELDLAVEEPRMEFKVETNVVHESCIDGVVIHGRPDLYFKTKDANVIKDWKVNGYCGKAGVSPKPGFVKCRDGWNEDYAKHSKSNGTMHKNCQPMMVNGSMINVGKFFEAVDKKWADQLTSYGWVLGESIGAPLLIGIEQLACKPGPVKPLIRVASHRGYVSAPYQLELYKRYAKLWKAVHDGHLFTQLSYDDSLAKQTTLDNQHLAYTNETDNDKWFTKMTRKHAR